MDAGFDYPPEVLGDHPGEPKDWGLAPDDEDDE